MTYQLTVSQGRIADRTSGAILGAKLTAEALANLAGLQPTIIGVPSPAKNDDWSVSLREAQESLRGLQNAVSSTFKHGKRPLMVVNTCSASLASLPVVARECPDAIVLWIDAHGDFNTPQTTKSGYLGGMVLAAACGLWDSGHGTGLNPQQVMIIGGRDIDAAEEKLLAQSGVRILAPAAATPSAILAAIGDAPVWIHIDWDVLEPGYIPAAYAISDGLLPQNLRAIFAAIPAAQIAGVELAEFEASGDAEKDAASIATIIDVISPLLAAR